MKQFAQQASPSHQPPVVTSTLVIGAWVVGSMEFYTSK